MTIDAGDQEARMPQGSNPGRPPLSGPDPALPGTDLDPPYRSYVEGERE